MRTKLSVALCAVLILSGCAALNNMMSQADVELLALDLQDTFMAGTVYEVQKNPEHRNVFERVDDELRSVALSTNEFTFDYMLATVKQLALQEIKSQEAILLITPIQMTLRRVGKNVELGNIKNVRPLALGIADGIRQGLALVDRPP